MVGVVVGLGLSVLAPRTVQAQAAAPDASAAAPDANIEAALQNLASRASLIFVGQVVAIERHTGVVEVVFRVDRPVRGEVGATYTLREWAGLWPPGQWRYTAGERAMVFLHAASAAGFSSAVDGGEGVVPVVGAEDGTPLVDVRRLGTRVLRQVGEPLPGAADGAMTLQDAVALIAPAAHQPGAEPQPVRTPLRHPLRRPLPPALVGAAGPAGSGGTAVVELAPDGSPTTTTGGRTLMRGPDAIQ